MSAPLEVFCCYAREDQEMLMQLKKHLAPLERQGLIKVWSDANLNAGVEWEKELRHHLESADIILLLISPDFMASDYCYSTEMSRAIVRHTESKAVVIPILLRSTFWQNAPFAKLQIIPTNVKPVTSWPNHDDAFHGITIQIHQIVLELHNKHEAQVEADEPALITEQQTSNRETRLNSQTPPTASTGGQPNLGSPSHALTTRPILHTFTSHTGGAEGVALSADGRLLASDCNDGTIKLWDIQTGQLLRTIKGSGSVSLSADGRLLASGSNTIALWNIVDMPLLYTLEEPLAVALTKAYVTLSADGLILAGGGGETIKLWNTQTAQLLHTLTVHTDTNHTNDICSIALSADGLILAGGGGETIKLWNTRTAQLLHTLSHFGVNCVALSADGLLLASGGDELRWSWDGPSSIRLWNTQTGQLLHTLIGHIGIIGSVALSTDGLLLASGAYETIKLWNTQTGQLLHTLTAFPEKFVSDIALSADGRILACCSYNEDTGYGNSMIKLWEVKD